MDKRTASTTSFTTAASEHSYPPTPPAGPVVLVQPPSPRTVHAKLSSVSLSPPRTLQRAASSSSSSAPTPASVTHFVLTPRDRLPDPAAPAAAAPSLFSRLVAALRSNAPAHDYSFVLAPVPQAPPLAQGAAQGQGQGQGRLAPAPLLAFHDQTPVWTARCSSGVLEMDEDQCRVLGVEPAFYVAVALTYLEFLEDREVSRHVVLSRALAFSAWV